MFIVLDIPVLISFVLSAWMSLIVGSVWSGMGRFDQNKWFKNLKKPKLYPPSWMFGVAWLILYNLMGFAAYFFWRTNVVDQNDTLKELIIINKTTYYVINVLYFIFLFGLAIWNVAFIQSQSLIMSLVIIIIDLILAIILAVFYFIYCKIAFWLFIWTALWLAFATYLNFSLYMINPKTKKLNEKNRRTKKKKTKTLFDI